MKEGLLFNKIILSSWFQAAIPSIIIIFFLPSLGSRYSLKFESAAGLGDKLIFSDLNSDNITEKIIPGKGVPYYYISVYDNTGHIYDQWNLPGKINPFVSELITGNYDKDIYEEIYVFTHIEDSLFLNVNELLQPSGTKMERLFITKIGIVDKEITSFLNPVGFFDENEDGKDEFYFEISTAFTQQPRKVFFYDLANKKLTSSQYSASICLNPVLRDIDNDYRPEIFGISSASGNYMSNAPFSDSSTWFMVFDDHLRFKFPPVEFAGFANGLDTKGYMTGNFKGYILSHWLGGTDTTVMKSQILIYDTNGRLIRSKLLQDFGFFSYVRLILIPDNRTDRVYLAGDRLSEINENLEEIRSTDLPFHTSYICRQFDLNYDRVDEILLYFYEENKLVILNSNLQKLIETDLNVSSTLWKFDTYVSEEHKKKTYLEAGNAGFFLNLEANRFYYLIYLAFPGIYLFFYFFILLIKRFNTFQVVEKEVLKQRLATLQLLGIKSQLDPHFTFNTLNSISSLIYLEDRQSAYDYMNKFTQMLRVMLNDAERLYRSLGEEIEFVTTYLDLEKLRYGDKFNYIIDIKEGVTQKEQVPKLVLQTFAENAIKHGLMPCSDGGILIISVFRDGDYLNLSIEDNGIGREKSSGKSTSTGKGLKLTGEFYDILNQMNKKAIKHYITDLYNENGVPSGTRVEVMVPLDT